MAGKSIKDCFANSFLTYSKKIAISFLKNGIIETEISYAKLDQDSNRLANVLSDWGVEKGDRVILYLKKSLIFVVIYFALQKIGAITVPLNPGFKRTEIVYFVKDVEPKLVLAGAEQEAVIKETVPASAAIVINTKTPYQKLDFFHSASEVMPQVQIGPGEPALIIYTSGTTGKPKGTVLTQRNLIHDAYKVIKAWEITSSDVLCHALPLYHVHGLCFALHTALLAGCHTIMLERFSPREVIKVLSTKEGKYSCTLFMGVPSMYTRMMDQAEKRDLDFSHMRLWTSGSAPLLARDFEKIKQIFGKEPVEREGMSETGMNFSNPLHGKRKPGSVGLPLPNLQVRIVDPDTFVDVRPGQTGEIWLKGPGVTPGYWQKPEETSRSFENGWFKTGDLGFADEDGYYYLTDRIKHIIISGGENISPKEIELVINRVEEVVESCVVGIPDDRWGEKVVAAVVTKPGSTIRPDDIIKFCRQHLHDWKCPKEIVFVTDLPKNRLGKVLTGKVKKYFQVTS